MGDFQGVACQCLDRDTTVQETIFKLLDLTLTSTHHDIECYELKLANKYYRATVQLFDLELTRSTDILRESHAVILYGNGTTLRVEQLDETVGRLGDVVGEPRILVCHGVDEECGPFRTLQEWCIDNGYDLILADSDEAREQMIDSLSAYKWRYLSSSQHPTNDHQSLHNGTSSDRVQAASNDDVQLDGEVLRKLADFDSLLRKFSTYRDNPEIRGDPNDETIQEIAELLSGLLGDELDDI